MVLASKVGKNYSLKIRVFFNPFTYLLLFCVDNLKIGV